MLVGVSETLSAPLFVIWASSKIERPLIGSFGVRDPEILVYENLCAKGQRLAFVVGDISHFSKEQESLGAALYGLENWHYKFVKIGSKFDISRNAYFCRPIELGWRQFYISRYVSGTQHITKSNFGLCRGRISHVFENDLETPSCQRLSGVLHRSSVKIEELNFRPWGLLPALVNVRFANDNALKLKSSSNYEAHSARNADPPNNYGPIKFSEAQYSDGRPDQEAPYRNKPSYQTHSCSSTLLITSGLGVFLALC
jgi:hypothetical protein